MTETLLQDVEASLSSPEFKARLFAILARAGLYRPNRASLIHYRAQTAQKLIEQGSCRADTRETLQTRFGVSRRTAYRLINRAIDMRQGRLFE